MGLGLTGINLLCASLLQRDLFFFSVVKLGWCIQPCFETRSRQGELSSYRSPARNCTRLRKAEECYCETTGFDTGGTQGGCGAAQPTFPSRFLVQTFPGLT